VRLHRRFGIHLPTGAHYSVGQSGKAEERAGRYCRSSALGRPLGCRPNRWRRLVKLRILHPSELGGAVSCRTAAGSGHSHQTATISQGTVFFRCSDPPSIAEYLAQYDTTVGMGEREGREQMATLDEIGQEKQKVSERLARLDAEREKLGAQLNELEVAERVLTRFGRTAPAVGRRRGRPARTAPAPAATRGRARAARAAQPAAAVSLSDATLRAVQAHPEGATASEVLGYLAREFAMTVRPNHLGIALQRHRRAGRLESRDSRWFMPHASQSAMSA
jgi:hypothetical protein